MSRHDIDFMVKGIKRITDDETKDDIKDALEEVLRDLENL